MIYRKILINLFCAFIVQFFLLIRWLPNLIDAVFYQKYVYYNFKINSLSEFILIVYGDSYIIMSLIAMIFIFLPFQLIKDYYYKKGVFLNLFQRIGILTGIFIILILIFGAFNNIWVAPWYKNILYLAFAIGFGTLFSIILYFTIDRYEIRKSS